MCFVSNVVRCCEVLGPSLVSREEEQFGFREVFWLPWDLWIHTQKPTVRWLQVESFGG